MVPHPFPDPAVAWQMPEITGINRLPARPSMLPYQSHEAALAAMTLPWDERRASCPDVLDLCGDYEFELFAHPDAALTARETEGREPSDRISVPGNWTMQGWDRPWYTNVVMPFPHKPPSVPQDNPTGWYRRRFRLPEEWTGGRVVLHLGGAESVGLVSVNDRFVGMAKDSRLPTEFDVTGYLHPEASQPAGEQVLDVMVIRWSDGSFVEDQDQWWTAGLHREVYLYRTGSVHLANVGVTADFEATTRAGRVDVEITIGTTGETSNGKGGRSSLPADAGNPLSWEHGPKPASSADPWPATREGQDLKVGWSVRLRLSEAPTVGPPTQETSPPVMRCLGSFAVAPGYRDGGHQVRASLPVGTVIPWNHEEPARYHLSIELCSPTGAVVEACALATGFRRVEVRERQLLINGQLVYIQGVNRHEHDPVLGKSVDRRSMETDITLMKRHHINAVRTSHYPNREEWYELCDQYGIYVVDEANIEAHHYYDQICRDPSWATTFLDRGSRMVLRDRNHPSIIIWSLGNESGYGANHDALAAWIRRHDPSRPIQYEGAVRQEWGQGPYDFSRGHHATDIVCPMYPPIAEITEWARTTDDDRPLIMCEYSHAMGNSCGSLDDYWHAIRSHHGLQGGFIWDWVDQGIAVERDGRRYFAYGGDFGEPTHDANFCANGLIGPDRALRPTMRHLFHIFQPVTVSMRGNGSVLTLAVHNRAAFTPLRDVELTLEFHADGNQIEAVEVEPPLIAAGETMTLTVTCPAALLGDDCRDAEILATARTRTTIDTWWAPSGFEIAWDQMVLRGATSAGRPSPGRSSPALTAATTEWVPAEQPAEGARDATGSPTMSLLVGGRTVLTVDGATGAWRGFAPGAHPVGILGGPTVCLWRAPTDNDRWKAIPDGEPPAAARWSRMGLTDPGPRFMESARDPRSGRLTQSVVCGELVVNLDLWWEGALRLRAEYRVPPSMADLPRLGIAFVLDERYSRFCWYGRGPHENYPDRISGAPVGRYELSVDDTVEGYLVPGEHGHRCDARELTILAPGERGDLAPRVKIAAADPSNQEGLFGFNISRFSLETLTAARHTSDLRPDRCTYLIIDAAHRGVGTGACGPDVLPRYRIGPGRYVLDLVVTTK